MLVAPASVTSMAPAKVEVAVVVAKIAPMYRGLELVAAIAEPS